MVFGLCLAAEGNKNYNLASHQNNTNDKGKE
jgi:hypothetical protein